MSWIQALVACLDVERGATLAKTLEECSLEPVLASNVEEVRIILLQRPVHLVFCEDNLPEGGFREVLRLVKATRPDAQVVVSSLLGAWEEYLEAMHLGAFDFVPPPYRGDEIVSIVYRVCQNYCLKKKDNTLFYVQFGELPQGGKAIA
jgi:two-component system, response regulator, stage 0 sporulation protein F